MDKNCKEAKLWDEWIERQKQHYRLYPVQELSDIMFEDTKASRLTTKRSEPFASEASASPASAA